MRARIDISEVEVRTKIRAKYLRAIENEEWDMLPGPIYVKSFLRTYSDFLGLDSRMLIDEYRRRFERPSEDPAPITTLGRRERERRERGPLPPLLPPWAVVGLVLLGIVVLLFVVGLNSNPSPNAGANHSGARPPHTTTTPTTTTPTTTTTVAPATVTLSITPTSRVYICMANQTGKLLIPGVTYDPGQTVPTKTASRLLLTLGNSSVTMKAGFGSIHVAPSAVPINLTIGPTSYHPLPVAQAPKCA